MAAFNDFTERFLQVVDQIDVTDYRLCKLIKFSVSSMSRVRNGKMGVVPWVIQKLCEVFPEVNSDFIITGREPMFFNGQAPTVAEPATPIMPQASLDIINRLQSSIEEKDRRIAELTDRLFELQAR